MFEGARLRVLYISESKTKEIDTHWLANYAEHFCGFVHSPPGSRALTPGGSASTRDLGAMRREEHVGYLGTGVQARVAQGARRDTLAKRSRLRQQPAVAGGYAQSGAGTEQMLSMLNQLTPDRRQRAADYVAQLLELQRAQEPGQPGARRNGVGGGPWAVRGPGNIAAAQSKAAMHVSGHMPGYNAAEPNVNFAAQPPQPSAPLSPLRLHALQP